MEHREAACGQSFAILRRRSLDALSFAGVLDQGVLGGEAFLRFVEFRGLLFGVTEGFERA